MENRIKELKNLLDENFNGNTKYDIEKVLIFITFGIIAFILISIVVNMVYHLWI